MKSSPRSLKAKKAGGWPAKSKAGPSDVPPLVLGVPIKWVSLILITLQTSAMVVLMRGSRRSGHSDLYLTSVAVFCNELTKLIACLAIIGYQSGWDVTYMRRTVVDALFTADGMKLAVPAIIYAAQNNLLYIALSNLEAAVFQVLYQLKILTTAVLSYFMLGRRLSRMQCGALLILFIGVVLVQLSESKGKHDAAAQAAVAAAVAAAAELKSGLARSMGAAVPGGADAAAAAAAAAVAEPVVSVGSTVIGLICVLISSCSSGFAGVYFERVVKSSDTSVWVRNIQLGFFGAIAAAVAMFAHDGRAVLSGHMFRGFNGLTVLIIAVQALGGLVTALVIKYADNILKGFATSISIILATIASTYLFHFKVSPLFIAGALIVMLAVLCYGVASGKAKRKSARRAARKEARSTSSSTPPRSSVRTLTKSSLSSRKKSQGGGGDGDSIGGGTIAREDNIV